MNPAAVLMCWNVPRLPEDIICELFSIAGPVEDISFAKSGKACFIIYEHNEAVITAKEIFKDLKINGRKLVMYDKTEIERIYSVQEEQSTNSREKHDNSSNNFKYHQRNEPAYYSRNDSGSYSAFNRNFSDYPANERHYGTIQGPSSSRPYHVPQNTDSSNENRRSSSMRNSSMNGGSYHNRADLLPSPSPSSLKRTYDQSNIANDPNDLEAFMNPYDTPVSRNRRGPSNSSNMDQLNFDDVPPGVALNEFMREKWGSSFGPNANKSKRVKPTSDFQPSPTNYFDPLDKFGDLVRRGDGRNEQRDDYGNHRNSGHYRDHSARMRNPDSEQYRSHGSNIHQHHRRAGNNFQNPFQNERDSKYNSRSRRY